MKNHYMRRGVPRSTKRLESPVSVYINDALSNIEQYTNDEAGIAGKTLVIAFNIPYEIQVQGEMIDQLVSLAEWIAQYFTSLDYSLNNSYYDWVQAYVIDEYMNEIDPDMIMTVLSTYENVFFNWLNNHAPDLLKFHIVYSDIFDVVYDHSTDTFYAITLLGEDEDLYTKYRSQALSINLKEYRKPNFIEQVSDISNISTVARMLEVAQTEVISYENNPR